MSICDFCEDWFLCENSWKSGIFGFLISWSTWLLECIVCFVYSVDFLVEVVQKHDMIQSGISLLYTFFAHDKPEEKSSIGTAETLRRPQTFLKVS